MLAQEIIHGIKKPKEGDNVVIKLNMAKAYDRVSWAYTCLVMRKMGFSVFFIEMIWRIMSNNWMLNNLYLNQNYQGFHMEPRGPQINHLSFADDVIIFTSGQRTSIQLIMKTLTTYEQVSNQLINRDKSHFMLPVDSPQGIAEMLNEEAGFTQKDSPINYLGCPLYIGGQRDIYYSHLVDKIAKRISGWQAKMLNFGGRLTIVKHVLHSIPIHTMAAISPPKTTLHYIKRLTADLFWGREKDKKKYHWASWENITFPYDEGGLGVRHLNDICNSLQYKQWWNFRSTNSLWGQFLKAKYCQRANPVVKNFWWDNWLGEGPLAHHTNESNRLNNNTISQYMLNGGWNETMCSQEIGVRPVIWNKPPVNYCKLNTDGSALANPGSIGRGGILRDQAGNLIFAFTVPLGTGFNNQAEVQMESVQCLHTYREANTIADFLAKLSHKKDIPQYFYTLSQLPVPIKGSYFLEKMGMINFRRRKLKRVKKPP
ncbi:uncharacterized protein LOC125850211 [Solanum stenotomum]|uniref:uncharacterized protein LOC125850211 n=1 Tax=Solanum stenotomum TaxID=172797 RepID=UPI0020D01CA6|nr:uncharacterized protein LOC125850211 [Solanum stenotomum]